MIMRKYIKPLILLCALLQTISDSYGNALDKFFQSLGGQVNHSTPGSFHDQAAGYYTGGGYVMRQNNAVVNPINISLPRFGVGCNSLDLYFGSLSFLKTERLAQLGRQVLTGIPTYGLQLALSSLTPKIEMFLSKLRKDVLDQNGNMLNSCELTQQFTGGMLPRGSAMHAEHCKLSRQSGKNKLDIFGSREHCNDPHNVNTQIEESKKKYEDLLMGEYNLVWHVLKKMDQYKDNDELAYFVMSITGTLVSKKDGDRFRVKVIEPRSDQEEFFGAYLKGGTTTRLVCNEKDKCLAPKPEKVTIAGDVCMKNKVITRILELRQKYISKEDITNEDIYFLNDAVNLPVYRYIQVSVAAGTHFMMHDAAEYIAACVLLNQFDRVMTEVLEAVDALQKIQLEDSVIAEFKQNLQNARLRLHNRLTRASNGSITYLNQAIKAIEQSIISKNT